MVHWPHDKEFTEQDFDEWLGRPDINEQKAAYFDGLLKEEGFDPNRMYYRDFKNRYDKDKPKSIVICATKEDYERYEAVVQAWRDEYSAALDAVKHLGEWSKEEIAVRKRYAGMHKQVQIDAKLAGRWTEQPITEYQLDIFDAIDSLSWSTQCKNKELMAKIPNFQPRYKFKDVKDIHVSSMCMQSLPCQHWVTVEMQDGTQMTGTAGGVMIYKMLMLFKGECPDNHLRKYARYNGRGKFLDDDDDDEKQPEISE